MLLRQYSHSLSLGVIHKKNYTVWTVAKLKHHALFTRNLMTHSFSDSCSVPLVQTRARLLHHVIPRCQFPTIINRENVSSCKFINIDRLSGLAFFIFFPIYFFLRQKNNRKIFLQTEAKKYIVLDDLGN